MPACVYAPGPWGNCLDLSCRQRGGRCRYVRSRRGRNRCPCRVSPPSRNVVQGEEVVAVASPIQTYRSALGGQPPCADPWFADTLSRWRAGDDGAWREISGRCLARVLDAVERRFPDRGEEALLDLVQDANAALVRAIKSFPGTSATDFFAHLDRELGRELDVLAEG
jgi:hypothetical protein